MNDILQEVVALRGRLRESEDLVTACRDDLVKAHNHIEQLDLELLEQVGFLCDTQPHHLKAPFTVDVLK